MSIGSDPEVRRRRAQAAREAGRRGDDRERTLRAVGQEHAAEYDAGAAEDEAARAGEDESPPEDSTSLRAGRPARRRPGGGRADRFAAGSLRNARRWLPGGRVTAHDVGGAALGLVVWSLALSYIKHGRRGPASWLSAKFLNKPDAKVAAAGGEKGSVQA